MLPIRISTAQRPRQRGRPGSLLVERQPGVRPGVDVTVEDVEPVGLTRRAVVGALPRPGWQVDPCPPARRTYSQSFRTVVARARYTSATRVACHDPVRPPLLVGWAPPRRPHG
ncbi:hypothetical protein DU504_04875 [Haloplanus salinus]|uniref:Uncharacterized protein n=1 Tax=Haloplanus salinus TaxID=1126245 RepID=A0A368N9I6_9EURY|nr:hypothetical protein DU504_04875 [Haloplanus salinus]